MVAVRNHVNEDRALLNFHKGDIIRLQHVHGLEAGEMQKSSSADPCAFWICEPQSECVSAAPLLTLVYVCASLRMALRQTFRLHSEKESHAFGGTEEGHF